jgi:elongation factor P
MVSTNNLKNGMTLKLENKLWQIVDWNHHKPGKGGAMVRTKLRDVEQGKVVEKTFRAGEDIEQAIVERKTLQYLYREGEDYIFMNAETYDQRIVSPAAIGDAGNWILEGDSVDIQEYDGRILAVDVPASVDLEITYTEPGLAGNTATNTTKSATLETGVEVQVPLFIEQGEKIKVDTRSGDYISRA